MRVVDLDRDMRDVIPTGTTLDSEFLFARMTELTLGLAAPAAGRRVLDVASGFGQDALALRAQGGQVVGLEPSARMSEWARLNADRAGDHRPFWVRGWSDALPFRDGTFDAVICKGAIDHFDRPERALAEMARVARPRGRVVLAIANFDSLACRAARAADCIREGWLRRALRRGRRHYDVPADHFTRYELPLMLEQAGRVLALELVRGVSLVWGLPGWSRGLAALPRPVGWRLLQGVDGVAARAPALADVVVLAGRPRRPARSARSSR